MRAAFIAGLVIALSGCSATMRGDAGVSGGGEATLEDSGAAGGGAAGGEARDAGATDDAGTELDAGAPDSGEIGRASCRERVS
jgi:hypothetical protein